MKRVLAVLCAVVFSFASAFAGDEKHRGEIAVRANELSKSLTAVETCCLQGVNDGSWQTAVKSVQPDLTEVQNHATWLHRKVRVKSRPGFDVSQLWRWHLAREINSLLQEKKLIAPPGIRAELAAANSGNASQFAKQCISLRLQLPGEQNVMQSTSSRKYKRFQDNFAALQASSGKKTLVSAVDEWHSRMQTLLFYFWYLHRGVKWVHERPDDIADPVAFALQQSDDVLKLTNCIFFMPKDSEVAKLYKQKLLIMTDAADKMKKHARLYGRDLHYIKVFKHLDKLDLIYRRWHGEMDYMFYWSRGKQESLSAKVLSVLDAQLPISRQYAAEQKQGTPGNQPAGQDMPQTQAPSDPFGKAIYEYNMELFANGGFSGKDARNIEKFKADMAEFVQIVEQFQKGAITFQRTFPGGLSVDVYRSGTPGGPLRKHVPQHKNPGRKKTPAKPKQH